MSRYYCKSGRGFSLEENICCLIFAKHAIYTMVSLPLGVVLGVFGCEYAAVDLRFLCVIQQRSVEVLNHSIGGHDSGLQEEPYPSARNKQRKKVSRKMSLNM